VLLVRHAVVRPDGTVREAPFPLGPVGTSGVAEPAREPALMHVTHTPWSRLVRRALLEELAIPFPAGIYEDLPVIVPVTARASRVAWVAEVCLFYRHHAASTIHTAGDDHLMVTRQWDLAQQRMVDLDAPALARGAACSYMARHLFDLLGSGRIPPASQRAYFRAAADLTVRWRPDGYRPARGTEGWKYRLLAGDHWALTVMARRVHGALRRVTGRD
jgi:hypothetical protein